MKQPLIPTVDQITLDTLFYALGNDIRLKIVGNLYRAGDKPLICSDASADIPDLSSSTQSYHFRILREGGVIRSERRGKECYNWLRRDELETKFPGVLEATLKNL